VCRFAALDVARALRAFGLNIIVIALFSNNAVLAIRATKKCGSTSLHRMMWTALNESWQVQYSKGAWIKDPRYFHSRARFRRSCPDLDFTAVCAVVRDPVSRMKSIYKHSVVSRKRTPFKNTQPPSWQEFVDRFPEFQAAHTNIRVHSQPQFSSIGDPGQYDLVANCDDINTKVTDWLNRHARVSIKPVHKKRTTSSSITATDKQVQKIQEYFADDYEHYHRYFK
jgi:hypothetical protein